MATIQRRGHGPWRMASVDDALSSPAIFAGVALISNTVATLSFEAYRKGAELDSDSSAAHHATPRPVLDAALVPATLGVLPRHPRRVMVMDCQA